MARSFAAAALTILGFLPFEASAVDSFTVYTDTFGLREGEVHNKPRKPLPLPSDIVKGFANRSMAIVGYDFDIVQIRDGEEVPLPLSSIYNHHYLMAFGTEEEVEEWYNRTNAHDPLQPNPAKACFAVHDHLGHMHGRKGQLPGNRSRATMFGGGSGAEYRHTNYDLVFPARHILHSPEYFSILLHFINTRGDIGLLECPCTSARKINLTNGTIDGYKPLPFHCNKELLAQGNSACSIETYVGGYRCCEDGVFVIEDPDMYGPTVQVAAKITVRYEEVAPEAKQASSTTCCDATGDMDHFGNIEYDIPKCEDGSDCVHMVESIQTIDASQGEDPDELIDLVWAYGHQHVGGMGMELYHLRSGQRLCESVPMYGKSDAAGDEDGYVVGISSCQWGPPPLQPPPRLRRGDLMRTVARYNSTKEHRGVMSLWLMSKVLVPNKTSSNLDVRGPLFV